MENLSLNPESDFHDNDLQAENDLTRNGNDLASEN
jgi:hypothetical protein